MNTYYLRCRQSKYTQLIRLARKLEVIAIDPDTQAVSTVGPGAWDYRGIKLDGPPPAEGQPDTRLPVGGTQNPFVHVNLRTALDLRTEAGKKAPTDPEIATEFAKLGDWFSKTRKRVNEQGQTTAEDEAIPPDVPMCVFL